MGIDLYLRWDGQTDAEKKAQYTGYSIVHGHVGYLREAYHGGPYATKVLAPEAWEACDAGNSGARIPASVLRSRLGAVTRIAIQRARDIYKEELTESSPSIQSFIKFVELAELKEAEGKNPTVQVSY